MRRRSHQRVLANARPEDVDDAIRVVDEFAYRESFMINVGDEKGALLDSAIERAQPRLLLELGTYCGYSALRTVRKMPADAHLVSIEYVEANADIARRILDHAGVDDRVTVVVGSLADDGTTAQRHSSASTASPGARSTSSSSTTTRTSTCLISSGSSGADGCTRVRWSSPTT